MSLVSSIAIILILILVVATFISEPTVSINYFKAIGKTTVGAVKKISSMFNKNKEVKDYDKDNTS